MATFATDRPTRSPVFSAPAVVAVVCAVASFFFNAGLGLLLAIIAIVAGVIGLIMALSPRVRGGIASTIAILAGLLGILAAVVKIIL